jgi:hypothetical protein
MVALLVDLLGFDPVSFFDAATDRVMAVSHNGQGPSR